MKDLLIFPYSGTAIEALDCLGETWNCKGFISDDEAVIGKKKFGLEVYDRTAFNLFPEARVLAVHGSPHSYLKRPKIYMDLPISEDRLATVIHPSAAIGNFSKIGVNVLIMAGAVISSGAIIGNHVVVLPNTVIHHDSIICDYTLIAANVTIAGNVIVGENCYLGASCSIKNGLKIASSTLIGMGAVVVKSIDNPAVMVGNPAKPIG